MPSASIPAVFLLGCLALGGCNQLPFESRPSTSQVDHAGDGPKNEANSSSGKTSDDHEGVPGYLVNPASVQALHDEKQQTLTLEARDGAVSAGQRSIIVIWKTRVDNFSRLGAVPVTVSGGFIAVVPGVATGDTIVVSVESANRTDPAGAPTFLRDGARYSAASGVVAAGTVPLKGIGSAQELKQPGPAPVVIEGVNQDPKEAPSAEPVPSVKPTATPAVKLQALVPVAQQAALTRCLQAIYGADMSGANFEAYRRLAVTDTSPGQTFTDPANSVRQLVYVQVTARVNGSLTLHLQNPIAIYCLDGEGVDFLSSRADVHCKAGFNQFTSSGRTVDLTVTRPGCT